MFAAGATDCPLHSSVLVQVIPLADGENDAQVLQERILVSGREATSEALQTEEERDRIKLEVVFWERIGEATRILFGDRGPGVPFLKDSSLNCLMSPSVRDPGRQT